VAAAPALRDRAEPQYEERERERRSFRVVDRGTRRRLGLGPRHRPGVWLIAFAVCVALLAVGRVTLSFAVVQKNMDTQELVREQRSLATENARLQDQLAGLLATPRLRELAVARLGLVPAQNVVYLEGTLAGDEAGPASAGSANIEGGAAEPAGTAEAGAAGDGGR
jgi:cell division protein FtsL